ncbi:MAG: cell division protein FtsA, partial [Fusobacterium necrophorum]|nr:cell division protein FtsA [Fusobacterium necrophorum]
MEDNITKLIMDIGNSHIKLLVGEVSTDFTRIKVLQYVEVPTKGMKKSVVQSSDELSYSIQSALRSLENP